MRVVLHLLPVLSLGACAAVPGEAVVAPPPVTPRTIVEMQFNSRALMLPRPGVPGSEAARLDGQRRLEQGGQSAGTGITGEGMGASGGFGSGGAPSGSAGSTSGNGALR